MDLDQTETTSCGICFENQITMPFTTKKCGHLFCYYCISDYMAKQRIANKGQEIFKCPQCTAAFSEIVSLEEKMLKEEPMVKQESSEIMETVTAK